MFTTSIIVAVANEYGNYEKASDLGFLFIVVFIVSYLIICFSVPSLRIKLEATPMKYFIESIKHMALLKTVVSLVLALIIGLLPMAVKKRS